MSLFLRLIALVVLFLLPVSVLFAQAPQPNEAWPAYPLAILLGFGIGHFYVGQNGTPFLVADLVGTAGIAVGAVLFTRSLVMTAPTHGGSSGSTSSIDPHIGVDIWFVAGLVLVVSRVWQAIDIFRAVEVAKKLGTVVESIPAVDVHFTSYEVSVALRY